MRAKGNRDTDAPPKPVTGPRRLFVGDLHGCLAELDLLLREFRFQPGRDRLFSTGDVMGKGPQVTGTLRRLRELDARVVLGNHDDYTLRASRQEPGALKEKQREYLDSLGAEREEWLAWISSWPLYEEMADIILVHAGLEPGRKRLDQMARRMLLNVRTWDGKGEELSRAGDPPWFECVYPGKTVVFGHWAARGLVDLPTFKGLDTGCVYGGKLTGWCPEEGRFRQVAALRAYVPIKNDG